MDYADVMLPEDYAPIAYIESNGAQYLNLGISPSDIITTGNMTVVIDAKLSADTAEGWLFGTRDTVSDNEYTIGVSIPRMALAKAWSGDADETISVSPSLNQRVTYEYCVGYNEGYLRIRYPDGTTSESDVAPIPSGETADNDMFLLNLNLFDGSAADVGNPTMLYSCKIYAENGTTLLCDLVPCIYGTSKAGMYDTVRNIFLTNAGAGNFTPEVAEWVAVGNFSRRALPEDYTQVEYIESFGQQIIDTKFAPNANTRIVMDVQIERRTTSKWLFGARGFYTEDGGLLSKPIVTENYISYGLMIGNFSTSENSTSLKFECGYRHENSNTPAVALKNAEYMWDRITIDAKNGKVDITYPDWHTQTLDFPTSEDSTKVHERLYLFGLNYGGTSTVGVCAKLYSCKIYDGDKLERDFVPCVTSNGIAGLYDMVYGVFYANAKASSSETPIKLPEGYVQLEYIKTDGQQYIDTGICPDGYTTIGMEVEAATDRSKWWYGSRAYVGGKQLTYGAITSGTTTILHHYGESENLGYIDVSAAGAKATVKNHMALSRSQTLINAMLLPPDFPSVMLKGSVATNGTVLEKMPYSIYLFALNVSGNPSKGSDDVTTTSRFVGKLYGCSIGDGNGKTLRNFVPCTESETGIMGLWDLVEGKMYPNQGDGVFAGEVAYAFFNAGGDYEEVLKPKTYKEGYGAMAKIELTAKHSLYDGMPITFRAPCDCLAVDGLRIFYEGITREFTFRDAHGNDLTGIGNLFSEGAYVKAVLDTRYNYAYLQNADTNQYLEEKIANKGMNLLFHKVNASAANSATVVYKDICSGKIPLFFCVVLKGITNDKYSSMWIINTNDGKSRQYVIPHDDATTPANVICYKDNMLLVGVSGVYITDIYGYS